MKKDLILTCDAGTTGVKLAVFTSEGKALSAVRREYATKYPCPGWAEQDVEQVVAVVFEGIKELLEQVDANRIVCIGISGTMNGCIPVDDAGKPLGCNIIHSDSRAWKEVEYIGRIIPEQEFYRINGNRLDVHYTLPKILWLRHNRPELYVRTRHWLNTKDYIYGCLTGKFGLTDYSDASLTLAFDINRRTWAVDMLKELGLRPERMPEVRPGHDVSGSVSESVGKITGLVPGTPVSVGGGDGACTARGAGVSREGDGYCYIGSSAWVSQLREKPVFDPEMRIFNYLDMDGKTYHVCGTVQCASAALDWSVDNLMPGERGTQAIYQMENMARQIAPGAEGVMFMPTLMGSRTPYWDANTRGALLGFTLYHDRRHVARAVQVSEELFVIAEIKSFGA